jgi:hypothetical protein
MKVPILTINDMTPIPLRTPVDTLIKLVLSSFSTPEIVFLSKKKTFQPFYNKQQTEYSLLLHFAYLQY